MELNIVNTKGEETGKKATLNDEVFAITPNDHAIWLDVKHLQANARQGTHKVKERNEFAGSTKKLHRQKGTGGARAGSIKNPVYGNGRAHGPRPRDYGFKLNVKTKRLARISALSQKALDKQIMVIEDFTFEAPKTKQCIELLKNLKLDNNKKTILVLGGHDKNVILSSRNLPGLKVTQATELNTYDILNCQHLILSEKSIPAIETVLTEK